MQCFNDNSSKLAMLLSTKYLKPTSLIFIHSSHFNSFICAPCKEMVLMVSLYTLWHLETFKVSNDLQSDTFSKMDIHDRLTDR